MLIEIFPFIEFESIQIFVPAQVAPLNQAYKILNII